VYAKSFADVSRKACLLAVKRLKSEQERVFTLIGEQMTVSAGNFSDE